MGNSAYAIAVERRDGLMNARFDRVVLVARDMERAMSLLSGVLGVRFRELSADGAEGGRVAFSEDRRIEVMAVDPGSDHLASHVRAWARALERAELALVALCFRVDDVAAAAVDASGAGISIGDELRLASLEPLPIYDFHELLLSPAMTGGLAISLAQYRDDRPSTGEVAG